MNKNHSVLSKIILGLILLCLIISICGVVYNGLDYIKAEREYAKLQQYVKELTPEDTLQYDIDWGSLYEINPDIVAWIVIPGTEVNYPVVQCEDNETYLHTSFEKEKNNCGAIFMDCDNHADFSDWNTIIYGHNMKDGSMFHVLNSYQDLTFYEEHKEVWICTPTWQRKFSIISAHIAKASSETYTIAFGQGEYEKHIGREVSQSIYDTGNGYNISLPMVTLSTCNGRNTSRRMVLVCQPIYEIRIKVE